MFNIIQFYQDHKIDYHLSGKNVMDGWVNIQCPFCKDESNHLGVFINRPRKIKCWRCGEHTLPELLSQFSDKDIKTLYKEYKAEGEDAEIVEEKKEKTRVDFKEIQKTFSKNSDVIIVKYGYKHYLLKRNFDPAKIELEWGVRGGIETGDYRYRLMIPIYSKGQIVSFQGRDVTGKQDVKYLTCHGTNIKNYLYGIDYVYGDRVIITEGVTDVWRLGKGNAIATFGIEYTKKQIELIVKRKFKHVIVFFDSEPQAMKASSSLISTLELYGIRCTNIMIPTKDPASLSQDEANEIVKLLNSKGL